MKRLLLLGLVLIGSCEDDKGLVPSTDGPVAPMDAAVDLGPASETGVEMMPATASRLERPTDLPRPPNGRLPADLLPPTR